MKKADALKGELRNIWNRKLYLWWRYYNQEYLSGALKAPLIRVGDGEHELGRWDGARRTLTISEAHIIQDPWLSVMDTLRHEMAHQYVEEIFEVVDEGPHGSAFQQACKRLRCIPQAKTRRDEFRNTQGRAARDEKIVRRLQKVLSLSASPNEHEAQAAVQKARYLLLKYSIDLTELDEERQFGTRSLGVVKGRRMSYELWLGSILNEFFFVEVLWAQSYDALRDRTGSVLQIFGAPANLDMAEYVYHYLLQLLDRLWGEYKAANGIRSNRERQRYFAGVLDGFYQKLDEQERTLQESYALVWKGDPKLQAFYRYLHPGVRTRYWGGVCPTQVYRDGVEEGGRVTIQQPIAERRASLGVYLTE
ncbi:MAG: SprT-like domain-containing protein [Acidobacteriota bacterium]